MRRFAMLMKEDRPATYRYFKPGYDPKLSTMTKWARALDCRISDLFEDEDFREKRKPRR